MAHVALMAPLALLAGRDLIFSVAGMARPTTGVSGIVAATRWPLQPQSLNIAEEQGGIVLQVVPDVRLQPLPFVFGAVSGLSVVDCGSVLISFDHHVAITHSALEKKNRSEVGFENKPAKSIEMRSC